MVERLTSPSQGAFRSTAVAMVVFGVAMGYGEAAVVVYLRSAIEAGSVLPAHDPTTFGTFEAIEVARELATLVMIGAVGWLAGHTRLERLAWAAVVFGAWDIVYYLGLRVAIGWPPAIDTWDVLFLIPVPWVAPVWAPLVVSVALVAFGLAAAHRLRVGHTIVVGRARAFVAFAGGGLVVASFIVDVNSAHAGDTATWTAWPFFWAGMALATGASIKALVGRSNAPLPPRERIQHGSDRRPSVGSPD